MHVQFAVQFMMTHAKQEVLFTPDPLRVVKRPASEALWGQGQTPWLLRHTPFFAAISKLYSSATAH